ATAETCADAVEKRAVRYLYESSYCIYTIRHRTNQAGSANAKIGVYCGRANERSKTAISLGMEWLVAVNLPKRLADTQRFRIELRKKVRIGRLVKVLSILGHATEGTANSHGFFEGGTELATPFEGSTSRKIAMKIPGASRSIGRRERKTSGRHAGGDHLTIEFGSDEPGPEDFGLALAHGWLHIARQEDMKNVVSQEGHEQKTFDSAWIMLEDVIGVPFVGQLIEAIILDIPSLVP